MDSVDIYLYTFTAIFAYIGFVLPKSLSPTYGLCARVSKLAIYPLKKQMRHMVPCG